MFILLLVHQTLLIVDQDFGPALAPPLVVSPQSMKIPYSIVLDPHVLFYL